MKRSINAAVLLLFVVSIAWVSGCLEDRLTEIVLNDETCLLFDEPHFSENYTTPDTIHLGLELEELLANNNASREDILEAHLVSASYEVKEFTQEHAWLLDGMISVQRLDIIDTPDTLVKYSNVTVSEAIVGEKTYVDLHEDGVTKINNAIDAFIGGGYPILRITIHSSNIEPDPSITDPLDFPWEVCLFIQALTTLDTEILQVF